MIWFVLWLICVIVAAVVSQRKGLSAWWILYIILLPPVAAIHALVAEDKSRRPCPRCAEPVRPAAKICPHCRSDLPADWAKGATKALR